MEIEIPLRAIMDAINPLDFTQPALPAIKEARLVNLSKAKGVDFQLLLNYLGAEQFLFRLSQSPYMNNFIFKGGALLTYLIDSQRKTKDLDFSILIYPPETIFAEKLQISLKKAGQNTRMKDYYDLFQLIDCNLNANKLKKSIKATFSNRNWSSDAQINYEGKDMERLQLYWGHFLKREKLDHAPLKIGEVIQKVNGFLKKLYEA